MAAGLGFKTFNTGDVLSAADVNGYLMQGVLVFADATARDAAITSPQEGQFAYTKDNNSLWYYTGSAWASSGATGDIEGVTAGTGISGGGTSGTVTITNSMATAIDAKGDLVVGTGSDTFSRLAVGTNGYLLTADSAEATGMKWAAAGGGSGLTLIQRTSFSNVANTGTTFDNIFTSTYKFYQVVIEKLNGGTNDHDSIFELLYSGTVESAGYYGCSGGGRYDTGNFSGIANSNTNQFTFETNISGSSNPSSAVFWFTKVGNTTENPNWHGLSVSPDDPVARAVGGSSLTTQRTYTGLRFRSSSSNITGTISVYGLATA